MQDKNELIKYDKQKKLLTLKSKMKKKCQLFLGRVNQLFLKIAGCIYKLISSEEAIL